MSKQWRPWRQIGSTRCIRIFPSPALEVDILIRRIRVIHSSLILCKHSKYSQKDPALWGISYSLQTKMKKHHARYNSCRTPRQPSSLLRATAPPMLAWRLIPDRPHPLPRRTAKRRNALTADTTSTGLVQERPSMACTSIEEPSQAVPMALVQHRHHWVI